MANDENKDVYVKDLAKPTLISGVYKLTTTHTVKNGSTQLDQFDDSKHFTINGPQFELPAKIIHAVFPADGAVIDDNALLPKISFAKDTLPWQRLLDENNEEVPWLAVLLLRESEMKEVEVKSDAKLSKLKPTVEYTCYTFDPEYCIGKSGEDTFTLLNMPADLFNKIIPLKNEIHLFAHLRRVKQEPNLHHRFSSDEAPPAERSISVVNGNRIPAEGVNHAFLVSLESMSDFLPEQRGASKLKNTVKQVGLVCLHRWSYTYHENGLSFKSLVHHLADQTTRFRLDHSTVDQSQPLIHNTLKQGFVPLPHHLRNGQKTLSWYRGPLTPHQVSDEKLELMVEHADELEQFDPELGMFNESYAAAWQLGRLLALKDKGFSTALIRWKEEHHTKIQNQLMRKENLEKLGLSPKQLDALSPKDSEDDSSTTTSEIVIKEVLKPLLKNIFTDPQ